MTTHPGAAATPVADAGDRDAASIAQVEPLVARARRAQAVLAELSQEQIDAVVDAMAAAVVPQADTLARLAVDDTGFGVVADKVRKNLFAARDVHAYIRPMRTVGVVSRDADRGVIEIAEPFGVVAAIIPSTNPTSTTIYKLLICIKARCAVIISPHPSAARAIEQTASLMKDAAVAAGLPPDAISWMTRVTLGGTDALMRARGVALILATGGMGLVRAAYSTGKPAYGVGPGNAPCYVEQSADIGQAARDILIGKCFDNGLLCSSPNSVVVDRAVDAALRDALRREGAHFLTAPEADRLAAVLVTPRRLPAPDLVGRSAATIAERAGLPVPPGTRALIAEPGGVGRDFPLSIEKLCPVLSYYVVNDWREGCERCKQILGYGGLGHTMSIHSTNEAVILEFGLHKPAFRIVVNTPTTHGSIGLTTNLPPALTLGCGGLGGNSTSDNITPRHLLNLKRLAYGVRPPTGADRVSPPATLRTQVEQFLARRGYRQPGPDAVATPAAPVRVVCEDDVRQALQQGVPIPIDQHTILTPSAREAAEGTDALHWVGVTFPEQHVIAPPRSQ